MRPLGAIVVGFATFVGTPGALVMGSVVGIQLAAATRTDPCLVLLGIGSGSLAWFVGMAHVSVRCTRALGARMHRVVKFVGGSIALYGAHPLARRRRPDAKASCAASTFSRENSWSAAPPQ